MENPSPNLPDLRSERRYASKVGFALLVYALASLGLQYAAQMIIMNYSPALLDNSFAYYAALLLPTYILGTPVCAFVMHLAPAAPPEKKKMRPSQFFVALLMCMTLLYAGNLLGNTFGTLADRLFGGSSGISELIADADPLANIIFVVILAPVVEELIFRKFIVDRFRRYGEAIAVVSSGLLFGLFHGNFYQFFYAALLGMFFAFIYAKTGRIRLTVILHMIINFFGGVVSTWIVDNCYEGYEALMEIIPSLDPSQITDELMAEIITYLPSLTILSAYSTLILGAAVAGFVLFIVKRRKFKFSPGPVSLESDTFSVTWVNAGVILFTVFCAVLFALNLTA